MQECDAEREHKRGPEEKLSTRSTDTHTSTVRGWCRGTYTHARTWQHGGARCTVAQVRRPFALPLQSTRRGSVVKSPAECCCSHRQALRTSADAPRARQDDDDAHSPPLLLLRLLRTGRSAPPEFGTRLPLHPVPAPHHLASPTLREPTRPFMWAAFLATPGPSAQILRSFANLLALFSSVPKLHLLAYFYF